MSDTPMWRRYLRLRGDDPKSDVHDELEFHFAMRVRDLTARGMSEKDARRQAEREFGDLARVRRELEEIGEKRVKRERRLDQMRFSLLDFKVGLRMLARYPGLTVVGTAAIAVAIALGTLYFEGLNKWLDPRIPVPAGDRIVAIHNWDAEEMAGDPRLLHDFAIWRTQSRTIEHMGAARPFSRNLTTEDGRVEPVSGAEVTASAFRITGTAPLFGRTLTEIDEDPGEPPVAVIGEALWRSRFLGDTQILGKTVELGSGSATIVGVMPESFGFPATARIWVPLRADGSLLAPRTGPEVQLFGRLAPGVSREEAEAELAGIAAAQAANDPEAYRNLRPRVIGYGKLLLGGDALIIRNALYGVNVVFLMLLGVVAANVATLVFARTAMRSWEITVRNALGATRGRIISQLFIEALVLAALAAVLGLILARLALEFGLGLMAGTDTLPFWVNPGLSWRTVLYAALLTLFGAAIVGVLPALRITRTSLAAALRSESAGRSGLRFGGFWTAVIIIQVAFTVFMLPLAAGGIYESNRFKQRAEGIGADRYITAVVGLDREDYAADPTAFETRTRISLDELERRLAAEPGVEGVAFADRMPVEDQMKYVIEVDTTFGAPSDGLRRSTLVNVSSGFFDAFGTSIVSGRNFSPADFETRDAMIVNESFARDVFGGRNPIGQRVRIVAGEFDSETGEDWYEVVGVVRDFGWQLPRPEEQAAMYRPRLPIPGAKMAVRVADARGFAQPLRRIAADVDPIIRLTEVQPLTNVGGGEARTNWALTAVAWVLSLVVLLLSATGIHSLMAFTVARRTREIGVRVAIGAQPASIVTEIFSRALLQVGAGVLVGCGLATAVGIGSPRQLVLVAAAAAVMLIVGLGACVVPLRRGLAINPAEALRAEV